MVETELLLKRNLRDEMMNDERLEVLDKVKEIVTLSGTDLSTTEQVANYYEVGIEAIKSTANRNKLELESNGLITLKGSELKAFKGKLQDETTLEQLKFTSQLALFNKRSILNVGMLLEESSIAKEVRTLLLDNHFQLQDIHEKLVNGDEIEIDKTSSTYFVDKELELRQEEKSLLVEMSEAILKGDMNTYMMVNCKANNIKEQLIVLEKEKSDLMKPKADKWDKFLDSNSTYSFTDVSKLISTMATEEHSDIDISVVELTKFLRSEGILCKTKTPDKVKADEKVKKGSYKNLPNKDYESYFDVVSVDAGKFKKVQARVKPNGIEYIYDLLKSKQAS